MGDQEKIADEMLVMRLLAGFHVDEDGREVTSYLRKNSFEERRARTILARQLRDGTLGYLVKELLALAIDPRTPSAVPDMRPTRKIKFESPARGKPPTWARDLAIIHFIRQHLHKHPSKCDEPAVVEASEHYGIDRTRVWKIWTQWRRRMRSPK
jgi:hypothetical protein